MNPLQSQPNYHEVPTALLSGDSRVTTFGRLRNHHFRATPESPPSSDSGATTFKQLRSQPDFHQVPAALLSTDSGIADLYFFFPTPRVFQSPPAKNHKFAQLRSPPAGTAAPSGARTPRGRRSHKPPAPLARACVWIRVRGPISSVRKNNSHAKIEKPPMDFAPILLRRRANVSSWPLREATDFGMAQTKARGSLGATLERLRSRAEQHPPRQDPGVSTWRTQWPNRFRHPQAPQRGIDGEI